MKNQSAPSLLISEPPLQVLPSLAVLIGLNEAIILQQLHYWLAHKQRDPSKYAGSFKQGRWWVYNSIIEWQLQFPFWSDKTISRALNSLKAAGLVTVEQLGDNSWDHTNWYSINYDVVNALANGGIDPGNAPESIKTECSTRYGQIGGIVQDKVTESLSETSSENTHRIHQRRADALNYSLISTIRSGKPKTPLLDAERIRLGEPVGGLKEADLIRLCDLHGYPVIIAEMELARDHRHTGNADVGALDRILERIKENMRCAVTQ